MKINYHIPCKFRHVNPFEKAFNNFNFKITDKNKTKARAVTVVYTNIKVTKKIIYIDFNFKKTTK